MTKYDTIFRSTRDFFTWPKKAMRVKIGVFQPCSSNKLYHLFSLSWKIADFSAKNPLTKDGFPTSFHPSPVI